MPQRIPAVVFAGGMALGSYQAGAWQALQEAAVPVDWIAGSSAGAINGALVAGSRPEERLATLAAYWTGGPAGPAPLAAPPASTGARHVANWMSVLQARLFGSPRHLLAAGPRASFASFYDLAPTAAFLRRHVDFGRLNAGGIRFTACATDLETGDMVLFDTGRGDRIEVDHLLASCGFLPEFAPVAIGDRLLGDGALCANAPLEPVLDALDGSAAPVLVVDLFARTGRRPTGLESALARKNALLFGNQTFARLDLYRRFWERSDDRPHPAVLHLSYLPVAGEAGAEMMFDFSQASARDRWREGLLDGREALRAIEAGRAPPGRVTAIRRVPGDAPDAATP